MPVDLSIYNKECTLELVLERDLGLQGCKPQKEKNTKELGGFRKTPYLCKQVCEAAHAALHQQNVEL